MKREMFFPRKFLRRTIEYNSVLGIEKSWKVNTGKKYTGKERNLVSISKIQLEINAIVQGQFYISNLPTKDLYRSRYCYIIKAIIQ